jgi:hypothetical protein
LLLAVGIILLQAGFLGYAQLTHDYLHSDGLTLWFMRGKLFFDDKGVRVPTMVSPLFSGANEVNGRWEWQSLAGYPILVSLNVAWTYLLHGREAIMEAKSLWWGMQIAMWLMLLVVARWSLGRKTWGTVGLVAAAMAVPVMWRLWTPHWFGGADLWQAGMNEVSLGCLYAWRKTGRKTYVWLAGLLLGGAAMTKVEGLAVLAALPIIYWWGWRRQRKNTLVATGLLLVPLVGWYVYAKTLPIDNSWLNLVIARLGMGPVIFPRFIMSLQVLLRAMVDIKLYLLVWPVSVGVFIYSWYRGYRKYLALWVFPLGGWLFMLFSFTFSNLEFNGLVNASLERLQAQWVPSLMLLNGVLLGYLVGDKRQKGVRIAKP